jgi:hypothetical protein
MGLTFYLAFSQTVRDALLNTGAHNERSHMTIHCLTFYPTALH